MRTILLSILLSSVFFANLLHFAFALCIVDLQEPWPCKSRPRTAGYFAYLYGRVNLDILDFLCQLFFDTLDIFLETMSGLRFFLFSLRLSLSCSACALTFPAWALYFAASERFLTSRAAGLIWSFFEYAADPRTRYSSNTIWCFKELCSVFLRNRLVFLRHGLVFVL